MKKLFLILMFLIFCINILASLQIVIQPGPEGKDTYIAQNVPNTNYGSSTSIYLQNRNTQIRRTLIEFNLSSIPAKANITSAILSIYQYASAGSAISVGAHRLIRGWTETGATWNSYDGVNPWTNPGGDFDTTPVSTITVDTSLGWKSWNITSLVIDWYNGTYPNYGVILVPVGTSTTNNLKSFYSSDYTTNPSLRPKLIVDVILTPPIIDLISPQNSSVWNTSNTVIFEYNVTFSSSNTSNCSLVINNTVYQNSFNVQTGIVQNFTQELPNGYYEWFINCTDAYGTQGSSEIRYLTVNYTKLPYVTTDSPYYRACNIVYYKISVFDVNDQPIDSSLSISIIDPSNTTVQQVNTNTGNGGTGIHLGNYIINSTAQVGNWTIKAIAGIVKGIKSFFVNG